MKQWTTNEQVKSTDLNKGWFCTVKANETLALGDIVGYYFRKLLHTKTNTTSPNQQVRRDLGKMVGQTFTFTGNLAYNLNIAFKDIYVVVAGSGSYFEGRIYKTSGGLPTGSPVLTWNMGTPVTGLNWTTSYGQFGGGFSNAGISNGDTLCFVLVQHASASSAGAIALVNGNVHYNGSVWASQTGEMGVNIINMYYADTTSVGKSSTSYLGTTPTAFAGIVVVGGSAGSDVVIQHSGIVEGLSNVSSDQYDFQTVTFNSVVVGWKLPPDKIALY